MATPFYGHISNFQDVYEPAEDTFLLIDALELEINEIKRSKPNVILEIGCGSGLVSVFLSQQLNQKGMHICTDINPLACECTKETSIKNNVHNLDILNMSLVKGLLPKLKHQVDIILFNPPYVVTPSEETKGTGLQLSWSGGLRGREIMDNFFTFVPELLSNNGVFYLLVEQRNDVKDIQKNFSKYYFSSNIVLSRKAGLELLFVLKIFRNTSR